MHLSTSLADSRPAFFASMRIGILLQAASSLFLGVHALHCSVDALQRALPSNATVLSAVPVVRNGTFGQGAADLAYPTNPTNLPALCAVYVNVTSSSTSSFRFGLFLPAKWNDRFLAVGNGGFGGGVNWLDMVWLIDFYSALLPSLVQR